jgi:serine protease Do
VAENKLLEPGGKMEKPKRFKTGLITAALAITIMGAGYGTSAALRSSHQPVVPATNNAEVQMVPANFSDLAEKVRPGVVNIQVVKKVQNIGFAFPNFPGSPFGDEGPFGRFFDLNPPADQKQEGVGSGFIISRDGYILTNNHVVEDAERIKVKLASGEEHEAKVIGRDPKTDLALIRIDGAENLHPLSLGNSEDLKVGSWVVAVGSPFGLEQTVTQGIVSGKGRVIGSGPYDDFIQTDASINPGNSGGPLVNMKGEVVGINTAINPAGQGIGFAIPIDMAKTIVPQLEEKGSVTRGWLGIGIQEITPALEKSFGLKDKEGVLVSDVYRGTPADKAGIKRGDVIVQYDGKAVTDPNHLSRMVASTSVGRMVDIKLLRDGNVMERTVKVGEMEDKTELAQLPSHKSLGITVQELTPEIAGNLGLKQESGVVITSVEPGSSAAEADLRTGDVIEEVNRRPVKNVQDFMNKIERAKSRDSILLLIQRGQNTLFAALTTK